MIFFLLSDKFVKGFDRKLAVLPNLVYVTLPFHLPHDYTPIVCIFLKAIVINRVLEHVQFILRGSCSKLTNQYTVFLSS